MEPPALPADLARASAHHAVRRRPGGHAGAQHREPRAADEWCAELHALHGHLFVQVENGRVHEPVAQYLISFCNH